ncbi:uncharacterized protein IL334_001543 [Kwoniella shivajii]|uniref:J domain-containing protein n=1 Tax=Kwoniella shivajii TaxID=564305 RepID=A0ABZ1CTS8_9TREE|nr:hypothetical protein IL334_001543 [Kwoniella shivajii]
MAPALSEEEAALDPYALLELTTDANQKDVERAFRKKSLKCHPDRNPSPEAAIQFRQISLALGILTDQTKRSYVDNKLESDRRKKEKYAEYDKNKKRMVDALNAREEDAKRAKISQMERRKAQAEEEAIKDAGKRLLEEAQKRAMAAASISRQPPPPSASPSRTPSESIKSNPNQPEISSDDLTLILTFPSSSSSSSSTSSSSSSSSSSALQNTLQGKYGPIAHCVLTDPPIKEGKKKKGKKAVVEFGKGNWGGCWACWKDHSSSGQSDKGTALKDGVKVKWMKGEIPNWIEWAEKININNSRNDLHSNGSESTKRNGAPTINTPLRNTNTNGNTLTPSFDSAPDFGGISMSDLLSSHAKNKAEAISNKKKNEEFESMTLLRMRQLERERLEKQIRDEEGDDEGL